MNLTNLFLRVALLGAEWVMWVLVVLSLISVAIIVERFIYFAIRRVNIEHLTNELTRFLRVGSLGEARQLVTHSKSIECTVVAAGLAAYDRGPTAVSEAMLSAKGRARLGMDRFLTVLGTLGSNAPFIGLLGTVLGIIKASHDMQLAQAAKQTASNAAMAGVFEALVATAVGLFVAIPAVIAYNYFQRRVRTSVTRADSLAHLVLSLVRPLPTGTTPAAAARPVVKIPQEAK